MHFCSEAGITKVIQYLDPNKSNIRMLKTCEVLIVNFYKFLIDVLIVAYSFEVQERQKNSSSLCKIVCVSTAVGRKLLD